MASNINPNTIDGLYPVAGQDNDSQGFRDNFTNSKNNFTYAKSEIEDLQSKVILKSALSGDTLDNDFNDALVKAAKIQDFSEARLDKGSTSGTVTFSHTEGHYQTVTATGSLTFAFSNFPPAGALGRIRVEVTISNVAHTVTLPAEVSIGHENIAGISSRVITFDETGTYIFEFTTEDNGSAIAVNDITRNLTRVHANRLRLNTTTPTNTGQAGDVAGMIAVDGSYVYVCTGTYDGSTVIWARAAVSAY